MVIIVIGLIFSLTWFPSGILMYLTWEFLSSLSVFSFTADLLLKDNYKIIDLKEKKVNMKKEIKSQSSGVNMG
mgnify:CR=1 FL=1